MDDFTPLDPFGSDKVEKATENNEEKSCPEIVTEKTATGEVAAIEQENEATGTEISATVSKTQENEKVVKETTNEEVKVETQPDKMDKVIENQQQLLERVEALNTLFNAKIMHTDHEEKIIDQMHKELHKYKEDMYAQLVSPILLDLIEVRDSIMRMANTYLAKPEGEQSIPNKIFSDYTYDLQDILEKNFVDIYRSKSGDDFTPIKQRVIKKVATTDESLHGKVAESLSCGYSYNGRTISAEKIIVYYYEKPIEKNDNSEVIENG